MEFDYCLQSSDLDHDQEVMKIMQQSDFDHHEEGGGDGDGDEGDEIFYAEIRRQILLLTADDEEEDFPESRNGSPNSWSSASKGGVRGRCYPSGHFNGWDSKRSGNSMPIWVSNLWRNGNGTGVFIPKVNNPRSNHRLTGRNRNHERMTKIYKPVENKSL